MRHAVADRKCYRALLLVAATSSWLLLPNNAFAAQNNNNRVPHNNQLMSDVLAKFGQPLKKLAAVGQPPISRWQYRGYIVYFEYKRVITTVLDTGFSPGSG